MTIKMKENSRSFKVASSSFGITGGRYIAEDPMVAGRKAGKKLFEKAEAMRKSSQRNMVVEFELVEISMIKKVAYSKERYFYRVTRVIIPEKDRVTQTFKNGTKFTPKYTYKIKSVDKLTTTTDHRGGYYNSSGVENDGFNGFLGGTGNGPDTDGSNSSDGEDDKPPSYGGYGDYDD